MFDKKGSKALALMAATAFVLAMLLSGCATGAAGTNAPAAATSAPAASAQPSSAQQTEPAVALSPVTLIWHMVDGPQKDMDRVMTAVNEYLKDKINAQIDLTFDDWGEYDKKMQMVLASGEDWDIMFSSNWTNDYAQNSTKGAFLPLDNLLQKDCPDVMSTVPSFEWDALRVNGKIYGIPKNESMVTVVGVDCQKPIADKYGIDMTKIKKLDDLTPYLEKVMAGEPGMYMFEATKTAAPDLGFYTYMGFEQISSLNVLGVRLNDPDSKAVNMVEQPEYKAFYSLMREWYQKGYIKKDSITQDTFTPDLRAGKMAFGFQGSYYYGVEAACAQQTDAHIPFVGTALTDNYMFTSSILSSQQCINKSSKQPDRALMLLNLLWKDKVFFRLIENGQEGVDYTVTEQDGQQYVVTNSNAGYKAGINWEFGPTTNDFLKIGMPADTYSKWVEINKSAKASPLLGFVFNPEPVKTQIAQCQAVYTEFGPALGMGAIDPDANLPQYLDKLKKAGMDDIITECQKQIDAWKASK